MSNLLPCPFCGGAALAMAGCDFGSTRVDSESRQKMPVNINDRVQVVKIHEFRDELAY